MDKRLRDPRVLLLVQVMAFWPVWRWYAARVTDGSDDPWCLAALATFVVLLVRGVGRHERISGSLWLPALLTGLYVVTAITLPSIFSAAPAVLAVGSTLLYYRRGRFFHPGGWGLLLLSLPLFASLQFCLGYPLRAVAGVLAAYLLNLTGFGVVAEGTLLNWGGQLVEIDAPCSGIKMLWAGAYLASVLACLYNLKATRVVLLGLGTVVCVIGGNALRASALFYLEAGVVPLPSWSHNATGIVVFAVTALLVVRFAERLRVEAA